MDTTARILETAASTSDTTACAVVHTRNFRRGLYAGVLRVAAVMLLTVAVATLLAIPPLISVPLMLGAGYFALTRLAGRDTLRLTSAGIEREWTPLASRTANATSQSWSLPWSAVRAFKHDRALSRSLRSYEYLEIDLDRDPSRLIATDRHDPAGFAAFRDEFLARVGAAAVATPHAPQPEPASSASPSATAIPTNASSEFRAPLVVEAPAPITQRRSFYSGPLAIVLAFVFTAVSIALLALAAMGHLSGGSILRLFMVVLPGTIYLDWRVVRSRRATGFDAGHSSARR